MFPSRRLIVKFIKTRKLAVYLKKKYLRAVI